MPSQRNSARWQWLAAVATTALLVVWLWPRSIIPVSGQGYDVALALYRVCNQRSEDGLEKIEQQLAIMQQNANQSKASQRAIAEIVQQAKAGQWDDASIACRQLLEDQVR